MSLLETPAASRARGRPAAQELVLRTTSACNQRCPFCFVERTGRAAAWADVEAELESLARRPGPRGELTLSGGEPAADPRLLRIVDAARARGFRRFVLQTNAVLLSRRGLLPELLRRGVRTYMVSFHSRLPDRYDRITGSRGQLPLAAAGLARLLAARACRVSVNVVVNRWNYEDLPGLMGFLGRLSAGRAARRRLEVCFSMINEAGHEKAPAFAVDLKLAAPYLRAALLRCRREGLRVERFAGGSAFPVCLTREPRRRAAPAPAPQDRVRYAESVTPGEAPIGRVKRPACRNCEYGSRCLGLPARYAAMFGVGVLEVPRTHG